MLCVTVVWVCTGGILGRVVDILLDDTAAGECTGEGTVFGDSSSNFLVFYSSARPFPFL